MICYFFAAIKVTIAPEVTPKALTVGKAAYKNLVIVTYKAGSVRQATKEGC